MQPLARDGLSDAQVLDLLHAPALEVDMGCDLLDASLIVRRDLTEHLVDGEVQWSLNATVHRTCTLTLTAELQWGDALVRPWMRLTDRGSGATARFNQGVFTLTTPQDVFGERPRSFSAVQGYDRLYLLDRPVGDSHIATAGTGVLAAVGQSVRDAGLTGVLLDGTAAAATLPRDMVWPFIPEQGSAGQTTWLNVVNDLLATVNYRGVWADENGLLRSVPYVEPAARRVEFVLDANDLARTLVGQDRVRVQDRWKQPNLWRFVRRNLPGDPPPEPVEGAGIYTVQNTTGQLTRAKVVELDVADQAALVAQGDRIVAADRRVSTDLQVPTAPLPIAGHADVLSYRDADVGQYRVQATQWRMPLSGGDMEWNLEVVA